MKEVYVLRHAEWDGKEDTLTAQGKSGADKYSAYLPDFDLIYSSPFVRTQQTAEIISGVKPRIESAASVPQSPPVIREEVLERRKTHPLGIAGALFEAQEAHPALKFAGQALTQLIQQALDELQKDQKALIISHDGTMVAAERILTNIDLAEPLTQTYNELEGFIVDENLHLKKLGVR
jgi:broad specificity phosphatase PhoE